MWIKRVGVDDNSWMILSHQENMLRVIPPKSWTELKLEPYDPARMLHDCFFGGDMKYQFTKEALRKLAEEGGRVCDGLNDGNICDATGVWLDFETPEDAVLFKLRHS